MVCVTTCSRDDGTGEPVARGLDHGGATVVVGMQWGDEGKGKVVDLLAAGFDLVARYNGGDNAGHALKAHGRRYGVRLVPAAILHAGKTLVIANGVVINPDTLLREVEDLESSGISMDRLVISDCAHLIMPWHKLADGGVGPATMGKGIGPAYADKVRRFDALRVGDVLEPRTFGRRLERIAASRRARTTPTGVGGDFEGLARILGTFRKVFRDRIHNTQRLLNQRVMQGQQVLLEGAQGAMLDVDHGTYPHVTSSSTISAGACVGTGLPLRAIRRVVGVVKAYPTRVGSGPFPTEADTETADRLRQAGLELGASTGMLRRCGWLDLVALRHAVMLNRPDELVLTKVDVLAGMGPVRVCTAYRVKGRRTEEFPCVAGELRAATPEYTTLPGWPSLSRAQWEEVRSGAPMPEGLMRYLDLVCEGTGTPIRAVSHGPGREETVMVGA